MILSTREEKGWKVIKLEGPFVVRNSSSVVSILKEFIEESETPHIAMDLSETTYMDSSAISLIVGHSKEIKSKNGDFFLFGANETIKDIFDIVSLDMIVDIGETLSDISS